MDKDQVENKMREQFEEKYPLPFACCWHSMAKEYWLLYDEHSGDEQVEEAIEQHNDRWKVWKSSRESLSIVRPYVSVIFEGADQDNEMVSACREAIEAAGLKVKP